MQTRTFFVDLGSVAVFAMILGLTVWLENLKGLKNKSGGFVQEHLGGCGNQLKQHETNYRKKVQEISGNEQWSARNFWIRLCSQQVAWAMVKLHGHLMGTPEWSKGWTVEQHKNWKYQQAVPQKSAAFIFCIFTYFRWTHRHIIVILPWYRHKKSHLFLLNATFLIAPPVL